MKPLLIALIFVIANSCTDNKSTLLVISSETPKEIDSVIIRAYGVTEKFDKVNLNPQQRRIALKTLKNKEGGFTISIYQKDSLINSNSFGYFVNESSIKSKYKIKILKNYSVKEEQEE